MMIGDNHRISWVQKCKAVIFTSKDWNKWMTASNTKQTIILMAKIPLLLLCCCP